jgi:hypothetical protein
MIQYITILGSIQETIPSIPCEEDCEDSASLELDPDEIWKIYVIQQDARQREVALKSDMRISVDWPRTITGNVSDQTR